VRVAEVHGDVEEEQQRDAADAHGAALYPCRRLTGFSRAWYNLAPLSDTTEEGRHAR
jgi:hypothetical protein